MDNKTKIVKNIDLASYKKKFGKRSHKLLSYTKKDVEKFDKLNKAPHNSILKGRKWALIGDTYYEVPKPVTGWFRNMNAAGKAATCLLGAGIVGGAIAAPIIINANSHVKEDVVIKGGEGLKDITSHYNASGDLIVTAIAKEENEGINKDSVKITMGDEVLEEDQFDIINDDQIEVKQEVLAAHPNMQLQLQLCSIVVDTPNEYELKEEKNPETGETETVAEVEEKEGEEPGEDLAIPSKKKKSGKKIDKVKIKNGNKKRKEKTKNITLGDDIKELEHENGENEGPFEGYSNLERARMPDNLKKFVKFLFRYCEKLKEIKGCKYTEELEKFCLFNTFSLEKFVAKNVTKMGAGTFACMLDEEAIKKGITESKLKEVALSDKLGSFPDGGFYNNKNLTTVRGGRNAKEVGEACYTNCFSLKELDFLMSETIRKIGYEAFKNTAIERVLINEHIDMLDCGTFLNSFKNDGMLENVYVDNQDFADLSVYEHDGHGILDNAKTLFLRKDIKLGEESGINDRFTKNEEKSKKDSKYDVYDAPSTGAKRHQVYNHRNVEEEEEPDIYGYRYTGQEENMIMPTPKEHEQISKVTHVNSHGVRNNKKVKTVDLKVKKDGKDTSVFTSIGTDMENGHSFHGCEALQHIYGLENVLRICAYSFMGTQLKEFLMPKNVMNSTLGEGIFKDHLTKTMTLTLQENEELELPDTEQVYNAPDDRTGMFEASSKVEVEVTNEDKVRDDSYLEKKTKEGKYDKKVETKEQVKKITYTKKSK